MSRRCDRRARHDPAWREVDLATGWAGITLPATPAEPSDLHAQRLQAVEDHLLASGVRSVADLGCGRGALSLRLLQHPQFERVVGVDLDLPALAALERQALGLGADAAARLRWLHGAFTQPHAELRRLQAVAMVETLEHVALGQLSAVEQVVFGHIRPRITVITTPNREFNPLFGMAPGQMREPGHHFEWTRAQFATWARGVARRRGQGLTLAGIGPADALAGAPSQMAVFVPRPAG
jgi:small RNA 2'-O-methyltransferase